MRILISLLVALAIVALMTKIYFSRSLPRQAQGNPAALLDSTSAKTKLASIAQAEQAYFAAHGRYAALDKLTAAGTFSLDNSGHDGYTYSAESSPEGFRAAARCAAPRRLGCVPYEIDQDMEVRQAK